MVKEVKTVSWTPIVIVGLILVFITIWLLMGFGGNSNKGYSDLNSNYVPNQNENQNVGGGISPQERTIAISGTDKEQDVASDVPIQLLISGVQNKVTVEQGTIVNKLVVSGVGHTITVKGTDIREILLSGTGTTLYLPSGSNPKITESGTGNKIIRN